MNVGKPIGPKGPAALLVCILLFLIYNSNLRLIRVDDSVPARLLPFSIVLDHSLYLDGWVEPYLPGARGPLGVYFVIKSHDHWMSVYPVIVPVVISPLYVFPAWWLSRQDPRFPPGDVVLVALIDVMEKLSASLLAALSAGLLYAALRKVTSPPASLLFTLIYGLASTTWTISSQALWRQGFTELSFALLLWALLGSAAARASSFYTGLAVGMAAANKPGDAVIGLLVFFYFLRHRRDKLLLFSAPIFVLGSLVIFHNLHFFGHLIGANPNPLYRGQAAQIFDLSHSTFPDAIAGLLASPSRGLMIYMPWTVFALWGAARLWRKNTFGWERYVISGVVLVFLGHARFWGWWAGWCFGSRYLTDLLPFLTFFLVPVWPRIKAGALLRAVFVVSVLVALLIEIVGAYYYPRGWWDARPVSVDADTRRLWDWSDTQIVRTWKAGPARPYLYDDLYLIFSQRKDAEGTGQRSRPPVRRRPGA